MLSRTFGILVQSTLPSPPSPASPGGGGGGGGGFPPVSVPLASTVGTVLVPVLSELHATTTSAPPTRHAPPPKNTILRIPSCMFRSLEERTDRSFSTSLAPALHGSVKNQLAAPVPSAVVCRDDDQGHSSTPYAAGAPVMRRRRVSHRITLWLTTAAVMASVRPAKMSMT